jgi:hypothetical protein
MIRFGLRGGFVQNGWVRVMYFNVIRGRYGSEDGSGHASSFT